MIKGVKVGLLVPSQIKSRESGKRFLEILPDEYMPETFNDHEPINKPFKDIESALECWGWGFFWRRKEPSLRGSAWPERAKCHARIYLSLPVEDLDLGSITAFFEGVIQAFGVDIGYIHAEVPGNTEDFTYYNKFIAPFTGLTTHHLREGLPGLCWGMLFGPPYAELFGDRLADVPVYTKRAIGNCTYVQLTESIQDVERKREEYEAAQNAAKEHLDSNIFREAGRSFNYKVPEFKLS